tara:strand:- start:46 stop:318 length:273 start_codon:yes stop_codon:yes gene_type:complete
MIKIDIEDNFNCITRTSETSNKYIINNYNYNLPCINMFSDNSKYSNAKNWDIESQSYNTISDTQNYRPVMNAISAKVSHFINDKKYDLPH